MGPLAGVDRRERGWFQPKGGRHAQDHRTDLRARRDCDSGVPAHGVSRPRRRPRRVGRTRDVTDSVPRGLSDLGGSAIGESRGTLHDRSDIALLLIERDGSGDSVIGVALRSALAEHVREGKENGGVLIERVGFFR